ncbi:MAG: hypothetical protein JWR01_2702 [Subtercola sp.]|nr:hypothetical protein [Subtercola sp.]
MPAYFEPLGDDRYRPTALASGAWNPGEIHFSPLGGLIVHVIDRHRARTARAGQPHTKQLGRISFDILGFLAADECTITVQTIRPGRTIELVEATVVIGDRPAVLARAWFVGGSDTAGVAGGQPDPLPGPDTVSPQSLSHTWSGGFVASLDVRPVSPVLPGRASVWLRSDVELVEGEEVGPGASFIALVDTANGIAVREPITQWMFPNLDLTVHLFRQPQGSWVGLDTSVAFGAAGLGLTSSVLHDAAGPVGRAEQLLTVRPAP